MRKLLALFCACLMFGGCHHFDFGYTAAEAGYIEILDTDGEHLWFIAEYTKFSEEKVDINYDLVEYDFSTGRERLISPIPNTYNNRCLEDGRFWFCDEEGLKSISLRNGRTRLEAEKGDESQISLLASAEGKMILRREYENRNTLLGRSFDYSVWSEDGEEILLDEQNPKGKWVIGWDGEVLVWGSWQEHSKVTIWKDGEVTAMPKEVSPDRTVYLNGDLYWLSSSGWVLYRRDPSGREERIVLPERLHTPHTDGRKLYLHWNSMGGRYCYDPETGEGYYIDISYTKGQRGGFFFAGEDYYYDLRKDGELTFVKDKLENRKKEE